MFTPIMLYFLAIELNADYMQRISQIFGNELL